MELINQKLRNHKKLYIMVCVMITLALMIAMILLTTKYVIVDGESMSPSLESGEYLIVNRLAYQFDNPEGGDMIVFRVPFNPVQDVVKRIIALPGETIEFRSTQVYINGILLDEPYLNNLCEPAICPDAIWQLGANEYFLMGDNRNQSHDSRFFGAIHSDRIIGEVMIRYYPLSEFGYPE